MDPVTMYLTSMGALGSSTSAGALGGGMTPEEGGKMLGELVDSIDRANEVALHPYLAGMWRQHLC